MSHAAQVGALVGAPSSDLDIFLTCAPADAEDRLRAIFRAVQEQLSQRPCMPPPRMLVTRSAKAVTFQAMHTL